MTAESRNSLVLIACLLTGPLSLLSNLLVGFALAPWVCGNGWEWQLHGIEFGFLLITLLAAWLAGSYWRRVGTVVPIESSSPDTRVCFLAIVGLMINALSALQIVGTIANSFILGPCQ